MAGSLARGRAAAGRAKSYRTRFGGAVVTVRDDVIRDALARCGGAAVRDFVGGLTFVLDRRRTDRRSMTASTIVTTGRSRRGRTRRRRSRAAALSIV